ncbi:hypothetical protein DFQ28_009042 [Apophysomyces sp. BC1034]|nr:hypothetical protein DFQ30_007542 [Apophysomyces sp. BC1015]KAG0180953.1 hypothetical protein DFQ29_009703 [Apophysomyces sp. BC1021]KAG0185639.1 hypothetical protein DFQ28_009042 [Apophysomyces sp. BC1034]
MVQGQIFKATYSGVPVYEMLCNDVAVMRRQVDSYLNATQILKVANFDKPHRTRILEREVQTGEHEKVQGGYGKYQGKHFGTWIPFDRALALAKQYNVDDSLKPIFDFVKGGESPPLAPKHNTTSSVRLPKPREPRGRKRAKPQDEPEDDISQLSDASNMTPSPMFRAATDSKKMEECVLSPSYHKRVRRREEDKNHGNEEHHAQVLLEHFISGNGGIPDLLIYPPYNLDVNVIIDDEGHTSLHWAAAMGRLKVVKLLMQMGADIYRVNYKGQTALMRSVLFTNNFDGKTFQELLHMLQKTMFNIDKKDQTVFHHVALTASSKAKIQASRYYMECLIEKLRHRSELISILNVQDVCGDTALTISARIGNKKLVRLLVDAGASTEVANEEGMTSQDYLEHTKPRDEHETRDRLRQKVESLSDIILSNNQTESAPAISHLFDGFAGSYERDLMQKEQVVREKKLELKTKQKRLAQTLAMLDHGNWDSEMLAEAERSSHQLEIRLRKLWHYSQKLKLARLIKEKEEERSTVLLPASSLQSLPSSSEDSLSQKVAELNTQLSGLQSSRRTMVDDIIKLHARAPAKRYQDYKRLISTCCSVAYENVDSMLPSLLALFDETNVPATSI